MNFSSMFPSKYLRASDFPVPRVLTISNVGTEAMRDGQSKPVVYFREVMQALVLNRTNGEVLADLLGDDTDNWLGGRIEGR